MDAPREVKAAIFLSLTVVAIETADRLWRISMDSHATTFTRLGTPNTPLPLRAEDAILRAKEALPTLGQSVEGWSFSELTLREESSQQFFYTVTFRPQAVPSTEWVQLVVYFSGKVTVPDASK